MTMKAKKTPCTRRRGIRWVLVGLLLADLSAVGVWFYLPGVLIPESNTIVTIEDESRVVMGLRDNQIFCVQVYVPMEAWDAETEISLLVTANDVTFHDGGIGAYAFAEGDRFWRVSKCFKGDELGRGCLHRIVATFTLADETSYQVEKMLYVHRPSPLFSRGV